MNDVEKFVLAPLFRNEVADLTGLIVRDDDLTGVRWMDKAAVKFGDGEQLLLFDGHDDVRCQTVTPVGRWLRFFMNSQAFGKPARHPGFGDCQDVDMAELMPHRSGPMKRAWRSSRGAVHGNDVLEGHTERAQAGHAHGSHREVLMIRIDLELNRARKLELVLLFIGGECPP